MTPTPDAHPVPPADPESPPQLVRLDMVLAAFETWFGDTFRGLPIATELYGQIHYAKEAHKERLAALVKGR